ncbi:hypothetical protein D3C84_863480 [compost metagenome]
MYALASGRFSSESMGVYGSFRQFGRDSIEGTTADFQCDGDEAMRHARHGDHTARDVDSGERIERRDARRFVSRAYGDFRDRRSVRLDFLSSAEPRPPKGDGVRAVHPGVLRGRFALGKDKFNKYFIKIYNTTSFDRKDIVKLTGDVISINRLLPHLNNMLKYISTS